MYRFLVLPLLFLLIGCNSDELSDKDLNQVMELQIEGENYTFIGEEFGGNENCGSIFTSVAAFKAKHQSSFRIFFALTIDGLIENVLFIDYQDNNRHYKTADFNASENFFIYNYNFSEDGRSLSYDFEGTLYERDKEENTKDISGKVNMKNLKYTMCSLEPWELSAEINHNPFNVIDIMGKSSSEKTEWIAFSNDRFKISVVTEDKLENMPEGAYTFSKNDSLNRVTLENYTGPSKATGFNFSLVKDWEGFQYEGVLIIEEQRDFPPRTNGTFQLKAYKDDKLIYEVTNGTFSI